MATTAHPAKVGAGVSTAANIERDAMRCVRLQEALGKAKARNNEKRYDELKAEFDTRMERLKNARQAMKKLEEHIPLDE